MLFRLPYCSRPCIGGLSERNDDDADGATVAAAKTVIPYNDDEEAMHAAPSLFRRPAAAAVAD